jgi:hypothetical protein
MAWPFEKPEEKPEVNAESSKAPEKSAAELIAEALQPFSQQFTEMRQKLDAIEQNSVKKPSPEQPREVTSVLDNEDVAFNQRLTPVVMRQLELEARVVKNDIKREYADAGFGDMWREYEKQINESLDAAPLVTADGQPLRGNPNYIRNVVDMVFGRAAREKGMRFDGKNKSFFLESGGSGGGNQPAPVDDGFSDSQRKALNKWGIPIDDAKKTLSKLKFIS